MKLIFGLVFLLLECTELLSANGFRASADIHAGDAPAPDSISATASTAGKSRLLPDRMSFVERGLWGEDGFVRSAGLFPPLTAAERRDELKIRREMLTAHLVGGIVTFGLMATAVYFGQRSIDHRQSGALFNDHQTFVTCTIISYSATGLLAILAPPPFLRRDETSSITIHKTLAWIHAAGMILTPLLAKGKHFTGVDTQLRIHQISAYATTATFGASMAVLAF